MRRSLWAIGLCVALALLQTTSYQGTQQASSQTIAYSTADSYVANEINPGPHVEKVRYVRYPTDGAQFLALEAGEIDLTADPLYPYYTCPVDMTDYMEFQANSSSYYALILNGRHYPYNLTDFRKAIAFAIDKEAIAEDAFLGYGAAQDSHIPADHPWFAEEEFDTHYIVNQSDVGNQILDNLGFVIDPETGWRNCSDESTLRILVEHADTYMAQLIAEHIVDALHSLHIDAWERGPTFGDTICDCCGHVYFETVMTAIDMPLSELVDYFWSGYNGSIWERSPVLNNSTYDYWRNQYMNAVSEEDAEEAIRQIQFILNDQVPIIPLVRQCLSQYVRTDRFEGFVPDPVNGVAGLWTARNAQLQLDDHQGSLAIGVGSEPTTFNPFLSGTRTSELAIDNLYSSLFERGPDGNPIPDLVLSMLQERHSDNPSVPEDHLRCTMTIVQNATWSDGVPVTSQDVMGTFLYILESGSYGNPAAQELANLQSILTLSPYTVRLEFDSDTHLIFEKFAYTKILPYHVFFGDASPGPEGWSDWDPFLTAGHPHVTCGPFLFSEYVEYEYLELVRNPYYHWRLTPRVEFTFLVVSGTPGHSVHYYATWASSIPITGPYILEANGTRFSTGTWEGASLGVNVDSLWGKTYLLRLLVNDSFGHSYENITLVYVYQSGTSTNTSSSWELSLVTLIAAAVSVASSIVIATMIFLSYKKKRLFEASA